MAPENRKCGDRGGSDGVKTDTSDTAVHWRDKKLIPGIGTRDRGARKTVDAEKDIWIYTESYKAGE